MEGYLVYCVFVCHFLYGYVFLSGGKARGVKFCMRVGLLCRQVFSRFVTPDMVENWGQCPFEGKGAGFPSNTMWPGQRPTSMRSFIWIHPTVWPQYTNVTDTTGQTDNGLTG